MNRRTGKITARHLYAAQVSGFSLYLPGIENQMEGNLIMGASRALLEEVAFNRQRVTSLDWVTYPIMRFADAPTVSTVIVQRTDLASTGAGEPPTVPVAAAIANAFFDATGVRIRTAPMSPGRVRAVLAAAAPDRARCLNRTQTRRARPAVRCEPPPGARTSSIGDPYGDPVSARGRREMGDPGFEPGTSALSERRSNQLS